MTNASSPVASPDGLSIALAQINPRVGDFTGNLDKLRAARAEAAALGADLVVFSELVVCGYPPEDLIVKQAFLDRCRGVVEALAADTGDGGPAVLLGAPWQPTADQTNRNPELDNPAVGLLAGKLYNAALLLDGGRVAAMRAKVDLPNYGVFDEKRLFQAGPLPGPMDFRGVRLGVMVCEDMWTPDVAECLVESGAEILIVPNGSPYETGKLDLRHQLAAARVAETDLPVVYVNQVGGQDELVFDGASFVLNADKSVAAQMPNFDSAVSLTRWRRGGDDVWRCVEGPTLPPAEGLAADYRAMMLGLADYVNKNGFPGVVLGLSGGIDSALSAAVAVDALGPDRVRCVMLPSPYTGHESLEDAAGAARMMGVRYDSVNIGPAMSAFAQMLEPLFDGMNEASRDVTDQNLQSRSRGLALMAISNRLGPMVLSTGNKSEMSVGYATLYGDMCGGYSVLKDVYKTQVFALSRWRNAHRPPGALGPDGPVMPERIITKPPTAELKPDQKDEDSLPPYDRLDALLNCLIERDLGIDDIVAEGHDRDEANRIWRLLELAEYKRRQAPPGVKITPRNLSRDRRYPITNAFKGPA